MTMKIMSKEFNLLPIDVKKLVDLIRGNRCRKLKSEEIDGIYNDIEEEVLLASCIYEMKDGGMHYGR